MTKNPRLSITFTKPQLVFLEREAARLGITVAETVRRIVDFHIEDQRIPRYSKEKSK
jgi:hypothetical protein